MASFQAKIDWKRSRKRKKKKLSYHSVLTRQVIENSKKREKKSKNQKIPLSSFQAKIGWKRPRNGENKNCSSGSFPLDA